MKEACTDLSDWPTGWQGWLGVAYRKQEGSCAWNRGMKISENGTDGRRLVGPLCRDGIDCL